MSLEGDTGPTFAKAGKMGSRNLETKINGIAQPFLNKKINTNNTHGTGCTLSSAIAMFLSCGKPLKKSCELGIKYVNQSIKSNLNYGKGHGPINHLSSIKIDRKFK